MALEPSRHRPKRRSGLSRHDGGKDRLSQSGKRQLRKQLPQLCNALGFAGMIGHDMGPAIPAFLPLRQDLLHVAKLENVAFQQVLNRNIGMKRVDLLVKARRHQKCQVIGIGVEELEGADLGFLPEHFKHRQPTPGWRDRTGRPVIPPPGKL